MKLPPRTESNLSEVSPLLASIIRNLWPRLSALAIEEDANLEVICGYRSQSEQNQLYAQGRTKPGPKVTWTTHSKHTSREAVDFGLFDIGDRSYLDSSDPKRARRIYQEIGKVCQDAGLRWGGTFGDPPHVELKPDTPKPSKLISQDESKPGEIKPPGISIPKLLGVIGKALIELFKPKK